MKVHVRDIVYLVVIAALTVWVQTRDFKEAVAIEAERPAARAVPYSLPREPICPRHDPTGGELRSSFASQAWGEEWVYECDYGKQWVLA